jgi:membrane protein DedA with SNARE-associated domain
MTINYIPPITFPVILMAVFGTHFCPPIPGVLFLIAAGALANYFPRTTSDRLGFNGASRA